MRLVGRPSAYDATLTFLAFHTHFPRSHKRKVIFLILLQACHSLVPWESAARVFYRPGNGRIADRGFALLRCIDYKRLIVADRFVALPAQCVADKCAVFGRPPVRRMRYLRACPAVTRFAIVFTGRPLSKNHGCCRSMLQASTLLNPGLVYFMSSQLRKKGPSLQRIRADTANKTDQADAAAEIVVTESAQKARMSQALQFYGYRDITR